MSDVNALRSDVFPSSVSAVAELAELFQRHRERLVAIVRRRIDPVLATRLGADDVVAQAYLAAGRRWGVFKANRRVSDFVWLYRIVSDTFVEEWRKATAAARDVYRQAHWDEQGSIDLCGRLVAGGPGPATEAARKEQAELLRQAVGALKPEDREVIGLRSRDELSFVEIAEHLGVGVDAATKRYVRALRKLKEVWVRVSGESRP